VSQSNIDQGQAAETPTQETKAFIRQVRASTRRKYAPEETRWENGSYSPNCRCPRVTTTGGGPVHCRGSKTALATVSGFPGISLAHRKRPQYRRRPGEFSEWSNRQLATWITDHLRLSVGGSTVYRLLKREGLVKPPDMKLLAGKEYQRKISGPHQMWATDASYFRVVGWGYYYMVTVTWSP